MRENIGLFRGKRIDNGEWVEGYLFCIWEKAYILWGTTNGVPNMLEVDPDTIGECTGLRDKSGKLVFEGDIHRNQAGWDYAIKFGAYLDYEECVEGVGFYAENITTGEQYRMTSDTADWCNIIGNATDNPELLKGGEGDG